MEGYKSMDPTNLETRTNLFLQWTGTRLWDLEDGTIFEFYSSASVDLCLLFPLSVS